MASDAMTSAAGAKTERRSPAPAAQSKRDRKRQALMERLSSMTDRFQREQDLTYRDQLQKIQYEISLVQRFDPYDANALDSAADLQNEYRQTQGPPVHADNARSLMDMAGIKFPTFLEEIEDLIEIRDFQLTQSKNEYDRKVQEYKNTHAYKVETAKREHKALTGTLRDRLINTLTQKKNRLNREKEVLEISDSNALLLNPSHFSMTNPGSPGGTHGKRATRLRKDADEALFADKKRKRNGNGDDDGSPVPSRRALDPNSTTPLWQSEKARTAAKQSGPVYTVDKLFTDKELSMYYNTAAVAAHQYVLRNRANGNGSSPEESDSDGADADSPPSAPMMERNISHATRGSTRGAAGSAANANFLDDRILGIEAIANFEVPTNLDLMHANDPPKMPPPVPQQYLKPYPRTADQNFPVPLSQDDILSDISVMSFLKQYDQTKKPGAHLDAATGLRKVLEAVAVPYQQGRFVAMTSAVRDDPEELRDALGVREPASPPHGQYLNAYSGGGAPMSRGSSQGGANMSRQGTTSSGRGRGRRARD